MLIINLYAKLQLNPRGYAIYSQISDFYQSMGMENEAEAFKELIRKKFNDSNSDVDQEQRKDNQTNS